jgi:MFS family permease
VLILSVGSGFLSIISDITATSFFIEPIKIDFILQQKQAQWVTLVYLIIFISFAVFSGDLGDNYGHKLIFQIGLIVFILGSILCFFSYTILFILLARVVVAIGVSMILPTGIGMLIRYTSKEKRSLSFGFIFSVIGIAVIIGVALAIVISSNSSWNYYYLFNIALGIISLSLVQFLIPKFSKLSFEKQKRTAWWADFIFAFSLAAFFFSLSIFIDSEINQDSLWAGIVFIISSFFVLFFAFTRRTKLIPIIGKGITKNRKITTSLIVALISTFGFMSIFLTFPDYFLIILEVESFQEVSKLLIGLPLGLIFSFSIVGFLSTKINEKRLRIVALTGIFLTLIVSIFVIKSESSIITPILISTITGLFSGLFLSINYEYTMRGAVREKVGVVSSLGFIMIIAGILVSFVISSFIDLFAKIILENRTGIGLEDSQNLMISIQTHYVIFGIIVLLGTIFLCFRKEDKERKVYL